MTEEKNEVIFDDDKISKSEEFVNPDELYQELIQCVQKYHPSDDISMIEKAYKVASEAHKNQFRKSGEPYIIHPLNVAIILADLKLDKETIVAGILHDVVEDTVMTEEDLRREFGDDVALLVDGVTKLEKIPLSGSNGEQSDAKLEMQAENLRKMFLAIHDGNPRDRKAMESAVFGSKTASLISLFGDERKELPVDFRYGFVSLREEINSLYSFSNFSCSAASISLGWMKSVKSLGIANVPKIRTTRTIMPCRSVLVK